MSDRQEFKNTNQNRWACVITSSVAFGLLLTLMNALSLFPRMRNTKEEGNEMKLRESILGLMMIAGLTIAASAQKSDPPKQPPPKEKPPVVNPQPKPPPKENEKPKKPGNEMAAWKNEEGEIG